jgi:hypothetical protein
MVPGGTGGWSGPRHIHRDDEQAFTDNHTPWILGRKTHTKPMVSMSNLDKGLKYKLARVTKRADVIKDFFTSVDDELIGHPVLRGILDGTFTNPCKHHPVLQRVARTNPAIFGPDWKWDDLDQGATLQKLLQVAPVLHSTLKDLLNRGGTHSWNSALHIVYMAYSRTLDKSLGSAERNIRASVEARNGLALREKLKQLAKPIKQSDIMALNVDRGEELSRISYQFEELGVLQYFTALEAKMTEFDGEDPADNQRPREWQMCFTVVREFETKNREYQKTIMELKKDAKRGRASMTLDTLQARLTACEQEHNFGEHKRGTPAKIYPAKERANTKAPKAMAATATRSETEQLRKMQAELDSLRAMVATPTTPSQWDSPSSGPYQQRPHLAYNAVHMLPPTQTGDRCWYCDEPNNHPSGPCFIQDKRKANGVTQENVCQLHSRHGVHAGNSTCTEIYERRKQKGFTHEQIMDNQHDRYMKRQKTRRLKQRSYRGGKCTGKGRGKGRGGYRNRGRKGKGHGKGTAYHAAPEAKFTDSEEDMDDGETGEQEEPEI